MKKFFSILCAATLILTTFALASCKSGNDKKSDSPDVSVSASQTATSGSTEQTASDSTQAGTSDSTTAPVEYTVTWMNGETVLATEKVAYGTTPKYKGETPEKAADAQYTYTFSGWDKEPTAVTGDAIYTATFNATVNEYTVTWKNGETVLSTDKVAYGTTPEYKGETPEKAGDEQYKYTFSGWDKEPTAVTGDATYSATFDKTSKYVGVDWNAAWGNEWNQYDDNAGDDHVDPPANP